MKKKSSRIFRGDTMPNLDNTLRSINRRIDRIAYKFGLDSQEYMRQKTILTALLPEQYIATNEKGIIRIIRGKTALQGLERYKSKIDTIVRLQLKEGTAIDLLQKYMKQLPGATIKDVRRMAKREFEISKKSDTFFYELAKELNVAHYFKRRKGMKGKQALDEYRKIVEDVVAEYEKSMGKTVRANQKPVSMSKKELLKRMKKRGV